MSAFTQGLQFGMLQGMYNNMFGFCGFGGFWGNPFGCFNNFGFMGGGFFNCSPFNFFSTPMFGMSNFMGCSGFYQYPYPQSQLPLMLNSVFSQTQPFSLVSNVSTSSVNNTDSFVSTTKTTVSLSGNSSSANTSSSETSSQKPEIKSGSSEASSPVSSTISTPSTPETVKNDDVHTNKYNAQTLKKMWQQKKPNLNLSNTFYEKIINISEKIECNPNDLMGIINIETGGTFSPSIQNPKTKATGLIQFMPQYASSYGASVEELKNMTAEQQLDYVEIYFVIN